MTLTPKDVNRILGLDGTEDNGRRVPNWLLAVAVAGLIIAIGILAGLKF